MNRLTLSLPILLLIASVPISATFAAPTTPCQQELPFGLPVTSRATAEVCHAGYAAVVDVQRKTPLFVGYWLMGSMRLVASTARTISIWSLRFRWLRGRCHVTTTGPDMTAATWRRPTTSRGEPEK